MFETSSIPIVTTHRGMQPYLACCLEQARKWNPDSPVVLLGDESNRPAPCTHHFLLSAPELSADLEKFYAVYQHLKSPLSVPFEQFCIARWFYLRNWMRHVDANRCLAIDSDVLLFCNANDEASRFQPHAMTFGVWGPNRFLVHCNYILDRSALEEFCEYVLRVYTTPDLLDRIKSFNRRKADSYWISDMSLFYDWATNSTQFPWCLHNIVPTGQFAYDDAIDNVRDFLPTGLHRGYIRRWKQIRFQEGVPYGRFRGGERDVPFRCLHYHGRLKSIMEQHARGVNDTFFNTWPLVIRTLRERQEKLRDAVVDYFSFR